ncbi:MAG: AAA family ATPase [Leptolyngbyaceae cyanobacterium]
MQLTFSRPHKSILSFPSTEIASDFAVITGINGAGKSHLLEAIENGAVSVQGVQPGAPHIRRFHHTAMQPNGTAAANPTNIWTQRIGLWTEIQGQIENQKTVIRANLIKQGLSSEHVIDIENVATWTQEHMAKVIGDAVKATQIHQNLTAWLSQADKAVWQSWSKNPTRAGIAESIHGEYNNLFALSEDIFLRHVPLDLNSTDVFQQNFAPLFASYYRYREQNKMHRYYAKQEGEKLWWLSDEEFEQSYGRPPWETVNEILKTAYLPLRVNQPTGVFDQPFTLKLHHTELGCDINYADLSSGEKIIISLAHCLYYARSENSFLKLPQLLLLDEPDAPLHPTMARNFMNVVEQVLVRDLGVKVIMTSHSPSTVAFAPEGSVYRLDRSPRKLQPCSKDVAIAVLTDGFATVMPTTRFVIVEAKFDQDVYQRLFNSVQKSEHWPNLPHIVFIRASDQENRKGGGCGQVSTWAEKLSSSGLTFVRGLLDRDIQNEPTDVICVLGRYSIENYLLDPIVIYACLVEKNLHKEILDLEELNDCNVHAIAALPNEKLQSIISAMCLKIKSCRPQLSSNETFTIRYCNEKEVEAPIWLRDERGHDLSQIFRECFRDGDKYLISKNLEESLLMMAAKLPGYISAELQALFIALAQ